MTSRKSYFLTKSLYDIYCISSCLKEVEKGDLYDDQYNNSPREGKKENENGNNNEYDNRPTILGGNTGLPNGVMLRHSEKRKIEKYQKRQRKYSNFNRMIMPKDWRQAGIERRSSVERQIWRLYIFQIFFRSCIDIGFMVIQFYAYPYQFVVPEVFVCAEAPCPHKVDCFISRPTEKTIFFNYKYGIAILTCLINILEVWYIGWIRIRRAFKEDGPPPLHEKFYDTEADLRAPSKKTESSTISSLFPVSDHVSERYPTPVKDAKETNPELPPAGNGGPLGGVGQSGPKYKRPNER